jgi:hypothetical protein
MLTSYGRSAAKQVSPIAEIRISWNMYADAWNKGLSEEVLKNALDSPTGVEKCPLGACITA